MAGQYNGIGIHHPHILPKDYVTSLEVEEGDTGEGTAHCAGLITAHLPD